MEAPMNVRHVFFVGVAALAFAGSARAQTTTGTIRGYVRDEQGTAQADARVLAVNLATGVQRTATTQTGGFYSLPGLVPGEYQLTVRRIGMAPQARRIEVLVGQSLTLDFRLSSSAVEIEAVTVTAQAVVETRTSEVATNVTPAQMARLPTSDRNFLNLATLAPGVRIEGGRIDDVGRTFSAGAQSANNVNVFIDGASYKNDLTGGGVAGQDASRGNAFPRNAVQEFRVITQNYKAEYQKASSAIIAATTRSGSNAWNGNSFFYFQGRDLVALDTFQLVNQRSSPTFVKPDYSRYQVGLSAGGPLIRDRLFLFASYEGNYQDRSNTVRFGTIPTGYPALDTVNLAQYNGNFGSPFRSTLGFGKLTYEPRQGQSYEVSYNLRHETDIRDFGGTTSFDGAVDAKDDVNSIILKHRRVGATWLEEATINFQSYRRHFAPLNENSVARLYCNAAFPNCPGIGRIGGNLSRQDFTQDRLSFRNDLTYLGLRAGGEHVIKVGGNVDLLKYDALKDNDFNPIFSYYASDSFAFPHTARLGTGNPRFKANNAQIGAYIQDDWSVTPRLTLNLGIRWDYESDMLNNKYVTPDSVRAALDTVVPAKYFTDGTQRPAFKGAFQPRVGLSYSLDADGKTTVFAGFGVYYDRSLYDDVAINEKYSLSHPSYNFSFFVNPADSAAGKVRWSNAYLSRNGLLGLLASGQAGRPEVLLVANDTRQPKSNQWSAGVRRVEGDYVLSLTYTGVRSYHGFTFICHNAYRTATPGQPANCFGPPVPSKFGNVFISSDQVRTWYDAFFVKIDRPYTAASRWGAGVAYTLSWAKRIGGGEFDGAGGTIGRFSFDQRFPTDYPRYYAHFDQRHVVVGNWIADVPFGGLQVSGVVNLATSTPFNVFDSSGPTFKFRRNEARLVTSRLFAYQTVDLRIRRDFAGPSGSIAVVADVFNLFNSVNTAIDAYGFPDVNYGKPQRVVSDGRRLQVGAEYTF
jgi:hypothetical protein